MLKVGVKLFKYQISFSEIHIKSKVIKPICNIGKFDRVLFLDIKIQNQYLNNYYSSC